MSEPTTTVESTEAVEAPEGELVEAVEEPQTFDADYVGQLRAEAAERRTEAKSASERGDALYEQLLTRTIEQATNGILFDASDLPRTGDYETDGFPDVDKIRLAAEELAQRKPYLSRARGDVSQGARQSVRQETLGEIVRSRGL